MRNTETFRADLQRLTDYRNTVLEGLSPSTLGEQAGLSTGFMVELLSTLREGLILYCKAARADSLDDVESREAFLAGIVGEVFVAALIIGHKAARSLELPYSDTL